MLPLPCIYVSYIDLFILFSFVSFPGDGSGACLSTVVSHVEPSEKAGCRKAERREKRHALHDARRAGDQQESERREKTQDAISRIGRFNLFPSKSCRGARC